MRLVIADTGPLNYLIPIGHIDLLPILFERVVLPTTVQSELASSKAPPFVRHWIANRPAWVEVREAPLSQVEDPSLKGIDAGEKAAIQLAVSLLADLLLMVDRKGVNAAQRKGLRVTGTLGILDLAARRGLSDFAHAVSDFGVPTSECPKFYWMRCWKNTRRKKDVFEIFEMVPCLTVALRSVQPRKGQQVTRAGVFNDSAPGKRRALHA